MRLSSVMLRLPGFMTAPSLELWRPCFALRKAQLRLLAYGFLLRRPCPLFQNEGCLSFRGELRFPLTCRLLCRTCGCLTSYANRPFFVLPSHPPMFASSATLRATRVYDATTTIPLPGTIPSMPQQSSVLYSRQNFFAVKLNHALLICLP